MPIGTNRVGGHPGRRAAVLIYHYRLRTGPSAPSAPCAFETGSTRSISTAPTSGCSGTSANNYGFRAALTTDPDGRVIAASADGKRIRWADLDIVVRGVEQYNANLAHEARE
jgi:hypothetical protein